MHPGDLAGGFSDLEMTFFTALPPLTVRTREHSLHLTTVIYNHFMPTILCQAETNYIDLFRKWRPVVSSADICTKLVRKSDDFFFTMHRV